MKAIVTKFHGPTATKPSRITASDSDGNSVTVSYSVGKLENLGDAYERAAYALCNKMGWSGRLIGGGLKNGNVYVFADLDGRYREGPFAVGRNDGVGRVFHCRTAEEAEELIGDFEGICPADVHNGEFYIDGPETDEDTLSRVGKGNERA